MGYSCTIQQEQEAIQALEDNGYFVNSESIAAQLNGDTLFFQEVDYENQMAWNAENGYESYSFSDWMDMDEIMQESADDFVECEY